MRIADFLPQSLIVPQIRAARKADVIRELAGLLAERTEGIDREELVRVLLEREKLGSTAVGEGIAIPHGKLESVGQVVACLGRSRKGIDFDSEDGQPTHFVFVLVAPRDAAGDHLKALARISRLFKNPGFRKRLLSASGAAEIASMIDDEDSAATR